VDLEVPAGAEIVLEGFVPPGERAADGPHVDHCGFQLPVRQVRRMEVRCITARRSPIHQEFDEGKPPNESTIIRGIATECLARHQLVHDLGCASIRNLRITEGSSGNGTWIVAIEKPDDAEPMRVAHAIFSTPHFHKRVIIVDDDIDIFDDTEVEWAQAFCVRWDRDLQLVPGMGSHPLDPSVGPSAHHIQGGTGEGYFHGPSEWPAAAAIDATRKPWFPPVGRFPEENRRRVEDKWPAYRLP
jgi:UbiD family decarboxylase